MKSAPAASASDARTMIAITALWSLNRSDIRKLTPPSRTHHWSVKSAAAANAIAAKITNAKITPWTLYRHVIPKFTPLFFRLGLGPAEIMPEAG